MKLIVGLGNPGDEYAASRHNIGFSIIKLLAKKNKTALKKEKGIPALSGKVRIGAENVILAMPLTFMNLSGSAVAALVKKYKVDQENLLVICDDLDLELGRSKIKPSGSSGGHRGLQSIINSLSTPEFSRLRIGIGRPGSHMDESQYVLLPFRKYEQASLREVVEMAQDCCESWIIFGVTQTMNNFNRSEKK